MQWRLSSFADRLQVRSSGDKSLQRQLFSADDCSDQDAPTFTVSTVPQSGA